MFKLHKLNIWLYNLINNYIYKTFDLYINPLVRKQLKDYKSIPIIIVNFNQLFYLKQLVNFLLNREFASIIIIDNQSTYPPLLKYYEEINNKVTIEWMPENYGHDVFFKNRELQKKYGRGFYILTDADIVPNDNLPHDFIRQMMLHLIYNWKKITKVGFALRIDNIPDENTLKEKIIKWERKFWEKEISKGVYEATLDTTFALYKPNYPKKYNQISFFEAHRFAENFTAQHGGWYIDQKNLTEEQEYYIKTASCSSSWLQENKNI